MHIKKDSATLRELAAKCKDAKERERLRALYALGIGQSVITVMNIFCVEESTIRRWAERWVSERSIADKPKQGRPPSLDENDRSEIKNLVEENNPKKHGINASFWDTKELQVYLMKNEKKVSRETIRSSLRGMGARYVKAQLLYPEADEKRRREFAEQFRREMASKPASVIVLFQDEMSAGCSPRKGYGWTFEERLEIKTPQTNRKRLNCFGAVNPLKGEVIQMSSKESKSPAFVRFLKRIVLRYPRKKIWIYTDNLPVHKSRRVDDFLEKHSSIELKYLPPYSPDLNLQEQWWNYERRKLLNNRYFDSTHKLATAISWFGKQTPPEQVMSICNFTHIEGLLH